MPPRSVLVFGLSRYLIYYLAAWLLVPRIVTGYVPLELYTTTCALSVLFAFWDRMVPHV